MTEPRMLSDQRGQNSHWRGPMDGVQIKRLINRGAVRENRAASSTCWRLLKGAKTALAIVPVGIEKAPLDGARWVSNAGVRALDCLRSRVHSEVSL